MKKTLNFVVMGDSAAYGTGDVTHADRPFGWAARIADAIESPLTYLNLARPGAKSSELVEHQLPIARHFKPDIAVVVVGGNDMLRNNFCPSRLRNNLIEILTGLTSIGAHVITLQLHDPSKILQLPKALESALLKRVDCVNAVYEELATHFPIISIKAREIEGVNERKNWHVDLLHPGPQGHVLLAKTALSELSKLGVKVRTLQPMEIPQTSRWKKIEWMVLKGGPWFFKRSFDLLPVALFLILKEIVIARFSLFLPNRDKIVRYGANSKEEKLNGVNQSF
jgi:lysophospholipase L1-like esterase